MVAVELRRLHQRDFTASFSAGDDEDAARLNEFLQKYAKQQERRQHAATTVAVHEGRIVGFVTIAPGAVSPDVLEGLAKGVARVPAPVLVLARMAVDVTMQRKGLGAYLLRKVVFPAAIDLAALAGCTAVVVDAKAAAITFYEKFGFTHIGEPERMPAPMVLPLQTIKVSK